MSRACGHLFQNIKPLVIAPGEIVTRRVKDAARRFLQPLLQQKRICCARRQVLKTRQYFLKVERNIGQNYKFAYFFSIERNFNDIFLLPANSIKISISLD